MFPRWVRRLAEGKNSDTFEGSGFDGWLGRPSVVDVRGNTEGGGRDGNEDVVGAS